MQAKTSVSEIKWTALSLALSFFFVKKYVYLDYLNSTVKSEL